MQGHVHELFIEFDTPEWDFIKSQIQDEENLKISTISKLQQKLWGRRNNSILFLPDINTEEFIDYFKWAAPHILSLPTNFPEGISKYYKEQTIRLNKRVCLNLLLALFFCCSQRLHTFFDEREKAKYTCLMTYFKLMRSKSDEELSLEELTIERKILDPYLPIEHWSNSQVPLRKLIKEREKKIEDFDDHYLKVDFANQYIGGGVLTFGCVQEEILFVIYPELLISMIFCEVMKDNEAIVINGARRVAEYSGYAWSFKFESEYTKPQDPSLNTFVAIDALMFPSKNHQFSAEGVLREINKAYIGFQRNLADKDEQLPPVVTGKWGCGEFGGFAPLKTLLMWIAASAAGRDMYMTTFRDYSLDILDQVAELYEGTTIGEFLNHIIGQENIDLLERLIEIKKNPHSEKNEEINEEKIV